MRSPAKKGRAVARELPQSIKMEISLCGQHKGLKGEGGASRKGAFRWRFDPALLSALRAGQKNWALRASGGET